MLLDKEWNIRERPESVYLNLCTYFRISIFVNKLLTLIKDRLPRKLDSRDSAYAMGGCILHFVTAAHRLRDHWKEI